MTARSRPPFGSYAKRIGLEPGLKITAVVGPTPGRPSPWLVYLPALALLAFVWWYQRRRAAAPPQPGQVPAPVASGAATR